MRYLVISRPAMSSLRVRWGRAKPSYTGQIWVTPSPESITTPVNNPKKKNRKITVDSLQAPLQYRHLSKTDTHRVGSCLSLLPLFGPLVKKTFILDRHIVPVLKVSVLETIDCTAPINANTFYSLLISVRILQLFPRGAYQEFYGVLLLMTLHDTHSTDLGHKELIRLGWQCILHQTDSFQT